ncbi:MAG: FAD-dependent oxidoreductase [Actinomycetota bacterium]
MPSIAIVGDGPGGLSAALFLAKAGHTVRVFGTDDTVMHYAFLYNYLGIEAMSGSDFQAVARSQVQSQGAELVAETVTAVAAASGGGFEVTTEGGTSSAEFLVLGEGKAAPLASSLGLATEGEGVVVDRSGRTSLDGVYVIGRSARPSRSQAIISAGDGAAAALDILATIEGKDVQDWDSPPKDDNGA